MAPLASVSEGIAWRYGGVWKHWKPNFTRRQFVQIITCLLLIFETMNKLHCHCHCHCSPLLSTLSWYIYTATWPYSPPITLISSPSPTLTQGSYFFLLVFYRSRFLDFPPVCHCSAFANLYPHTTRFLRRCITASHHKIYYKYMSIVIKVSEWG